MTPSARSLRHATLACALALAVVIPTAASGRASEEAFARAVPDAAPAVAGSAAPVIAWLAHDNGGTRRVHALAWPGLAREIGPTWRGADGTPAVAGDGDRAWVVAARSSASGSRLWVRRWAEGRWSDPEPGPTADRRAHHPAIAARDGTAWIAWVSDAPGGSRLWAARWNGTAWSRAQALPGPKTAPMAPSVAIAPDGRPVVAWASHDGRDAEIWVTRRREHGWSRAVPLSDNDVPDIEPSIVAAGDGVRVAWSRFAGDGYVPVATAGSAGGSWNPATVVSELRGTAPELVVTGTGPALVWAVPTVDGRGYELRWTAPAGGSWRPSDRLAAATSPRFTVAGAGAGLLLGWHDAAGPVASSGRLRGRGADATIELSPLVAARAPLTQPVVTLPRFPAAYTGFGDSITFGTVVFNDIEGASRGYPGYLGDLLSGMLHRGVTVINRGLPGETTSEGLGRLAGIVGLGRATDFMMLMEGANDITILVDVDTIAFNLQAMMNLVLQANRLPVLSTVTPRRQGRFGGPINENIDNLNARLRTVASLQGIPLVDNHDRFDGAAHLYSDNIHPNDQGYEAMAEVWFQGLKPILEAMLLRQDTDEGQGADAALHEVPDHPGSAAADTDHHLPGCC